MHFSAGAAPVRLPAPKAPPKPGEAPQLAPPRPVRSRRKSTLTAALAAALALAGLAYYSRSGGAPPLIVVPTATAHIGDINYTIRLTGTVGAQNEAVIRAPRIQGSRADVNRGGAIGAQTAGRGGSLNNITLGAGFGAAQMTDFSLVLIKLAPAGGRVKSGDVVAQFDPQMQQQRLDDYKDTIIQTEASIKRLMANLDANAEAHAQSVDSAKAAYDQAALDMQQAPVVPRVQAELYQLAMDQAKATWDELKYEDPLMDAEQRSAIQGSELVRDQSRLEQARAERNLKMMTLASPIDGVVAYAALVRNNNEFGQIQVGDEVHSGQPILYIEDPSSMVVNAMASQVDAQRLKRGMRATVHLDAYSDIELPGTVMGLGAMAEPSTFRADYVSEIPVLVKLDRLDPRLIPDLTASADILLDAEKHTLVAPREAVFHDAAGAFVYLQGPKGWVRQPVVPGLASFTEIAIHSGLRDGDVVALQRPD